MPATPRDPADSLELEPDVRTPLGRGTAIAIGASATVVALGCVVIAVAALRWIHDLLGPESEYLMGNPGYPCRALPPQPGLAPWLLLGAFVVPVVTVAGALSSLAWHSRARVLRPVSEGRSLGASLRNVPLVSVAIVAVAIAGDHTYLWVRYAAAGPHGQTDMCPTVGTAWHREAVALWAIAALAAVAAIAIAIGARRSRIRKAAELAVAGGSPPPAA